MKAVTFYTRKDVLQTPMEALKKSMTVETLTKMALCLALISVSAYIAIPIPFTPVLITAQTIIVNLIALLLTPAQSAFVISVYTLMGLCGLPVFSGGAGGIAKLLGPAGGYILGFFLGVIAIGLLKGSRPVIWRYCLVTLGVGLPIIHICAILYMVLLNGMDMQAAFLALSLPFLAGDAAKCVAASCLAAALERILPRIRRQTAAG